MWPLLTSTAIFVIWALVIARAILRPHRDPSSRLAWVMIIVIVPGLGVLAYLLLGETSIGRRKIQRSQAVLKSLPPLEPASRPCDNSQNADLPDRCLPLFRLGETINGFAPAAGNSAQLLADSNSAIDAIVADIDAANEHIHLLFYIWLNDNNGTKLVAALLRASARGVACRVMVDAVGSQAMIRSKAWREMRKAGVQVAVALPVDNPLLRPFHGRIDIRNHRKIIVIDHDITYCGSQNCADPEFLIKKKFAPWVDILVRFEGPVAQQNQRIFIGDWMSWVDEDIRDLLNRPVRSTPAGFSAQVIATGPTVRNSAMPEVFTTLMYTARHNLFITTPYYVPNESMQAALRAAAQRGVETTIVLPARNDSWQVAAASHSYYLDLLTSGVKIFEYNGGLLHAKTITMDTSISLIGSANLDRRSFDLNFENNILFCDEALTAALQKRQHSYLENATQVTTQDVESWSIMRKLWNNFIGMMGPVL